MLSISTYGPVKTTDSTNVYTPRRGKLPFNIYEPEVYFPNKFKSLVVKFNRITNIPIITWSAETKPVMDLKNMYLRSLASMYVATVKCGISEKMLNLHETAFAGGILRYHISLTYQMMMANLNLLKENITNEDCEIIVKNIPTRNATWDRNVIKCDSNPGKWIMLKPQINRAELRRYIKYESNNNDYLKIVPRVSHGITPFGLEKLTESILTLMYCVILAQGKTGFPIVNGISVGMVKLTQTEFFRIQNTIITSGDTTRTVLDVRSALGLLNNLSEDVWLDVCKGCVRFPANLVLYKLILKKGVLTPISPWPTRPDTKSESEDASSSESESESESESDDTGTSKYLLPVVAGVGLVVGCVYKKMYK